MEEQKKAGIQEKLIWTMLLIGIGFFVGYFIGDRKASRLWFDIGYRLCYKELKGELPSLMPVFPGDR